MTALLLALSLGCSCPCPIDWHGMERAARIAAAATSCDSEKLVLEEMRIGADIASIEPIDIGRISPDVEKRLTLLRAERKHVATARLRCELGAIIRKNRRLFEDALGINLPPELSEP